MKLQQLLLFAIIAGTTPLFANILTPDQIPDEQFRNYLIDHYGTLSAGEASSVNALSLENQGIQSLQGLHYFTGLRTLNIRNNDLTAIDDMLLMLDLTDLNAGFNPLQSFPNASLMPSLKTLYLDGSGLQSQVLDDAQFHLLTNLEVLDLFYNQLTRLPDLSQMTNLYHLEARFNEINDIAGLAANPAILSTGFDYVDLRYNRLNQSNAAQLAPLTQRAFNHTGPGCPFFAYYFQVHPDAQLDPQDLESVATISLGVHTPGAIADPNFSLALFDHDDNGDLFFCRHELDHIQFLSVHAGFELADIWGIQNFSALESLAMAGHNIETLAPLLENEHFVNYGATLDMRGNRLGEDYPTRCQIERLSLQYLNLDNQQNEVDWFQDPCTN